MKKKVVVGMSGGVDSSVAAVMLYKLGYDVIGITMKTWDYDIAGKPEGKNKETGCCSLESINDARNVAVTNGFPHYTMDFREDFGEAVISYFKDEYLSGRTPNPCVMCNTKVKWEALLDRAKRLGADYIATGHYARTRCENGRYLLSKGIDKTKDQSYALWGISQDALSKTIFPLGDLKKTEVRKLAKKYGLKVADKNESYEICFIPDSNYERFLKQTVPQLEEKVANGTIVDTDGRVLGSHKGYPFYTIGQRRGLGITTKEPAYVTEINYKQNTIKIGSKKDLYHRKLYANQVNWIALPITKTTKAYAMIRYKDVPEACVIQPKDEGLEVSFEEPKRSITPGQAIVFYTEREDVIGGGFIEKVLK